MKKPMRINLDATHYFEGDAIQFFIFHDAGKARAIVANCIDLTSVKRVWGTMSKIACPDLDEIVAMDKLIEDGITALVGEKMVHKVQLEGGFFIEFDKDAFCLESIRPQRADKSKNHGHFGRWHLHHTVITYKNKMIMHSEVQTKDDMLALMDSILTGIKESFQKAGLVDQGKPAGLTPNIPKSTEPNSGSKTKFLFK